MLLCQGEKGKACPAVLWKRGFPCFVCGAAVNPVCCSLLTDNVTLQIDGVLYLRVMDPYKVPSLPLGHLSPVSAHSPKCVLQPLCPA